jgi:uncharacterized protein (TIGR02246 family)
MRVRLLWFLVFAALVFNLTARPGLAQKSGGIPKEEAAALHKRAEAFVEAFHKGDAKALAAFWAPDGDYTDQSGRHLKGRAAIEKAFQNFFAEHKGVKVRIDSESLRFLTPDVAIEDGTTAVFTPDGTPPSRARYTIIHVKKNGQWHLSSVRDAPFTPPTNAEQLRGLDWAVGEWSGEADKGLTERLAVAWVENQNFLEASFSTTVKNVIVGSARQWVRWDPAAKQVRSWIIDASGGFGEGTWTHDGKKWSLKTTSVLQGGQKAEATYVLTRVDADTFTLQARDRSVGGKTLPDTKEVKMKRVR